MDVKPRPGRLCGHPAFGQVSLRFSPSVPSSFPARVPLDSHGRLSRLCCFSRILAAGNVPVSCESAGGTCGRGAAFYRSFASGWGSAFLVSSLHPPMHFSLSGRFRAAFRVILFLILRPPFPVLADTFPLSASPIFRPLKSHPQSPKLHFLSLQLHLLIPSLPFFHAAGAVRNHTQGRLRILHWE